MGKFLACAAVVAAAGAPCAVAGTISVANAVDFSGFANGADVEGFTFNAGTTGEFTITSSGNNAGLRIFDSSPGGPNAGGPDNDLVVPGQGNVLILQDNQGGIPNDANEGGTINFDFSAEVAPMSLTLIDIDNRAAVTITLFDANGNTRVFDIPDDFTGDPENGEPGVGGVDFGGAMVQIGFDSNATFTDFGAFDLTRVTEIDVFLSGSGAIDDLAFTSFSRIIPLPGAAGLALAGMVGIAGFRRR